ncbi:MAG: ATP-binding protein [Acidimicrobiia bacterium]|nr:ATP-binding protein [Acidimicrobiia bacterium]
MHIIIALSLPRDEQTIPVSRHIAATALAEIGVAEGCTHDIAVAMSEACTNVLEHSGPGDQFEVSLEVDDDQCVIRVVDTGHGFDAKALGFAHADTSAEQGRGIELMRALVDSVKFISKPEAGTIVHLSKGLDFEDWALARLRDPAPAPSA